MLRKLSIDGGHIGCAYNELCKKIKVMFLFYIVKK